jgi:hypothetical protein
MVRLTERDRRILAECRAARFLTTSQIQRMFFAGVSSDGVRKRLRKLAEDRYLTPFSSRAFNETLHSLGRASAVFFREESSDALPPRSLPDHIEHLVGINDVRALAGTASEGAPPVRLRYFFAHWELGQFRWTFPVIPDAVFCLERVHAYTFAVEYHRGTERGKALPDKLDQYRMMQNSFPVHAVLFISEGSTCERLVRSLRSVRCAVPLYVAPLEALSAQGFDGDVFHSPKGSGPASIWTLLDEDDV